MFMQFNDAARIVMRLAELEAQRFCRVCIGTEHLLLALIQLHDCVAIRVLRTGGINLDRVREEVEKLAATDASTTVLRRVLTPGCQQAIDYAIAAADRLGHLQVGTGHLLLGLLEEAKGVAFQVLCRMGIGRVGANLSRVAECVILKMQTRTEESPTQKRNQAMLDLSNDLLWDDL